MSELTIAAICAHPDDVEFLCGGTLTLLARAGHTIHIATMTGGDKGTVSHTREEIRAIRTGEAQAAAAVIGAQYTCLGFEDMYITYDRTSLNRTTELLRAIRPNIVFTNSPVDYLVDHEVTSRIVRSACFACGIKNMECPGETFEPIPWLYYADPVEGKDTFGEPVTPGVYVNITEVMETKKEALGRHESQRAWLQAHHGMDEYIESMIRFSSSRGREIGVQYAEGLRQHLGHSHPQDNILGRLLGDRVKDTSTF